jgi:hypothetical protein
MNCTFCQKPLSVLGYDCRHEEVIVRFFGDPEVFCFLVPHEEKTYCLYFRYKDEILIFEDAPGLPKILRIKHTIFPPEQAVKKLQQFLNLVVFS